MEPPKQQRRSLSSGWGSTHDEINWNTPDDRIAGYYTPATLQVDFSDLPIDFAEALPRRPLPVAVLAWLGIDQSFQGRGIGRRLLATTLDDCYEASGTFAFIALILDCVDASPTQFYQQFEFAPLPG